MAKAKTKTKGKKQGQIPGTERKEIQELSEAAEAYRQTVSERLSLQVKESEQKAHLAVVVHGLIEDGAITVLDSFTPQEEVIYTYEDDDGILREVKFKPGKESIKVGKSKINSGDDE